jgi:hypothetical protein
VEPRPAGATAGQPGIARAGKSTPAEHLRPPDHGRERSRLGVRIGVRYFIAAGTLTVAVKKRKRAMTDTQWADISEFQTPANNNYPYQILGIRSNDGSVRL